MTETAPLVINLDLRLAYCPLQGRMWRTDANGRILRELALWRYNESDGQYAINDITCPGLGPRRANRLIFFMLTGRWPLPGHVIDHRDRDPTNNRADNLREATYAQNRANCDPSTRYHGADEILECGVTKTKYGTYAVFVAKDYYGTYKSHHEANQIAREQRRRLYGEFALAPVTSRRMIRGSAP